MDSLENQVTNDEYVEQPVVQEQVEEQHYVDPDIEAAKADGWVEKENYRGDPDTWVDAKEFNARGKHINRILQSKLKKLEEENERVKQAASAFQKFQQEQMQAKAREHEQEIARLKAERAQAVREGDGDRFTELEDQITEMQRNKPEAPKQEAPTPDPEAAQDFERWKSRNSWYGSNDEATKYADELAAKLRRQGETRAGAAFLRVVEEMLRDERPELFTNPNRTRPSAVTSGGRVESSQSINAFKQSLSPADRQMMEQMVKDGTFKTEADFMNDYKKIYGV